MIRSRTAPCHPQCNGKAERFNLMLLSMLWMLCDEMESGWHEYVPKIVHAYNCTKSESRRYSLFLLLFRRSLRLPIAIIFGTSSEGAAGEYSDYVKRWKTAMTEAYALAAEKARLSATKGRPFRTTKPKPGTWGPSSCTEPIRAWRTG